MTHKPSPFVLPLSCGLLLYLLGVFCCAFRQHADVITPLRDNDTLPYQIALVPATATSPEKLSISSTARVPTTVRIEWQVLLDGLPGQKGIFPDVTLLPRHPRHLHLPLRLPPSSGEAWLRVTCRHAHTTFTQFLPLIAWRGDAIIPATGELTFNDSNNIFTIIAPGTDIRFDKQTGWLLHYQAGHALLMDDTAGLQPALWPGITPRLQLFSTSTGPQLVIVRAEYTVPETASLLHLSYTINSAGDMLISQAVETDTTQHLPDSVHLPALPGFGMRWLLPPGLDTLTCFGAADTAVANAPLTPAANRATATANMATTTPPAFTTPPALVHHALTTGMVTRGTRWLTLTGHDGAGLRITADSTLLETGTHAFTDTTTQTTRTLLLLKSPADSTRHYTYKVTPVPAKPF